jgi:hypothetical protein
MFSMLIKSITVKIILLVIDFIRKPINLVSKI